MARIGIDASRANVDQRTGTEWYIFNILQELKTIIPKEHQVILYTKEALRSDFGQLPEHWSQRTLHWPPKLLWTQLRLSLHMLWSRSRPDLLFIPAHTIPIVHPIKTVYVAHDLGFERYPDLYSHSYIGGKFLSAGVRLATLGRYSTNELDYHRWSMRFAITHAAKIITISKFTKQELQKIYTVPEEQIAVVYNGFTAKDYQPVKIFVAAQPYILFVGRLEHKKNIVNLIHAFAILKQKYKLQHRLKLVGSPGYGYEEIQSAITEHHLTTEIDILGYTPQSEMNTLMSGADLFVFPTQYEGFGIPVLEALSAGTIVACSNIPPLREVGGDACMYFDYSNPEDIAAVVDHAIRLSNTEKDVLRSAGQKRVQAFSWRKCAEQTWQVLQSVLQLT